MPVDRGLVGLEAPRWSGRIDARWLMAYAAGIGALDDVYLDTERPGGIVAHPVFPVAPEWDALTGSTTRLGLGLDAGERARGVHAGHDLLLHRPLRADTEVEITTSVAAVEATTPGALVTVRFDAVDADGRSALWTTWMRTLYRGVDVTGSATTAAAAPPDAPDVPVPSDAVEQVRALPRGAAHVYTECARIWNPIHTDRLVAHRAGLPDIILHGTATLAHGVSAALATVGAAPEGVRRLGCSFRAMVLLPSSIVVRVGAPVGDLIPFEVRNGCGDAAIRDGFVVLR